MASVLRTVVETEPYLARASSILSEEERSSIVDLVSAGPETGALIPGTGGLRKLRVAASGRGKRGGARVIYFVAPKDRPVYLLLIYAKNESDDLTSQQTAVLKRLIASIEGS